MHGREMCFFSVEMLLAAGLLFYAVRLLCPGMITIGFQGFLCCCFFFHEKPWWRTLLLTNLEFPVSVLSRAHAFFS